MKGSPWALREISTLQTWKKMTAEVITVASQHFQNWGQLYRKCQWHWRFPAVSLWMCSFLLTVFFLFWLPRHQCDRITSADVSPKAPRCSCWAPSIPCLSSCSPFSECDEAGGKPASLVVPDGTCLGLEDIEASTSLLCWLVWVQLWGWGGQHLGAGLQAQPCWWLGPGSLCAFAFMKKETQLSLPSSLGRNGLLSSKNYRPDFQPLQQWLLRWSGATARAACALQARSKMLPF